MQNKGLSKNKAKIRDSVENFLYILDNKRDASVKRLRTTNNLRNQRGLIERMIDINGKVRATQKYQAPDWLP